jgi:hypothetical protein
LHIAAFATLAAIEDGRECARPGQAMALRTAAAGRSRRSTRVRRGDREPLDGSEPGAALRATRREHLAAAHGLHPRAKAVRFCTMSVVRLERSLWHSRGAP